MEVERWEGVLDVNDDAVSLEITCDARSLRVRWGFNGSTSLSDKDRADIGKTIDTKVLQGAAIRFRSTGVRRVASKLRIAGELTIGTTTRRIEFDLKSNDDGTRADATASVRQTSFGIKPYSAMLATLKVSDDVEITARATLPRWTPPVVAEPPRETLSEFVESAPEEESIEPREPVLVAHSEPTATADAIDRPVPVAPTSAVRPAHEIEPWKPVARHYFPPKRAADEVDQHAPAEHPAPAPVGDAISPWQSAAPQHPAPTPAADAVEPLADPVPLEYAMPSPAADALEPLEHPAPTEQVVPAPATEAIEPLNPPVPVAHATPTPATDVIEPRQSVLVEDADAIEPKRPTPPPQVAPPREPTRRLGFFGPVRFR